MSSSHSCSVFRAIVLFSGTLCLTTGTASAQRAEASELSIAAGASSWDASGTGIAPVVALRAAHELGRTWLLLDGSLVYSALDEQFTSGRTQIGIAELHLQLQWPRARIRPYIGGGVGLLGYLSSAGGRDNPTATLAGALGLRVHAWRSTLLRGEMRVRIWHGTAASAAEFTLGIGRRF